MSFLKNKYVKISLIIVGSLALIIGGFTAYIYYQIYQIKSTIKSCELVSSDFSEKMSFSYVNNVILVKARVNNNPTEYEFVLDTGAPTVISQSFLDKLNLNYKAPFGMSADSNKAIKPSFLKLDQLELGGVKFEDVGALVMDDSKLGSLNCLAEGGIIGYNVLQSSVFQINYQDSTILLTDDINKLDNLDTTLYVNYNTKIQETPVLNIIINDTINFDFTFDTGYNGSIKIESHQFYNKILNLNNQKIAKFKKSPPITIAGEQPVGSFLNELHVKTDNFAFGPFSYNDLLINVIDRDDDESKALIGNKFFENFIITLDYSKKRLYFQPISENKLVRTKSVLGLVYSAVDNKMIVNTIYDGSKADEYGIRVGDEITSINDINVSNLSEEDVCKIFRKEINYSSKRDDQINFVILKNGELKPFKLERFKIFE